MQPPLCGQAPQLVRPVKRPAHKTGHPGCPHTSWAACDLSLRVAFGQCKAITGDREPVPCTRWAVADDGWCWQHYVSESERVKREARAASRQLQLDQKITAFLEWTKEHPSVWDYKVALEPVTKGRPFRVG